MPRSAAATFAPGDPERDLTLLRKRQPAQDPAVGEYWAGWFDHWGEPHARVDDAAELPAVLSSAIDHVTMQRSHSLVDIRVGG